ncbi:hypothetical protein [Vibrio harveyi]|uniref:hypothetical protein n=1 Tax=Vibrio harveyi TaxID=669 RepID=UPI0006815D0A|nr:hypothetical protein [Vibrio harveyi]PNM43639.1 hypothetical protein AL469_027710 [Vibrio harveyi]
MITNISRFVAEMEKTDLARPNLYLVILPSINNSIHFDDVIAGTQSTADISTIADGFGLATNTVELIANPSQLLGATAASTLHSTINGTSVSSLAGGVFGQEALVGMMCKSVNLPGKSYEYEEDRLFRRNGHSTIKSLSKDSLTMTFYCSAQYTERRMMMAWFESIYDSETSEIAFYDSYAKPIEVVTLQRDGLPSTVSHVREAYPIRIGEVLLDYENNNEIATFEVEFKYKDVKYLDSINSAIDLAREAESFLN